MSQLPANNNARLALEIITTVIPRLLGWWRWGSLGLEVALKKSQKNNKPDGRIQRSERSRQLIIDAMVAMINAGHMIPTAQQVADKADVAIRTVFRHFS